jgi:hypothetical protein
MPNPEIASLHSISRQNLVTQSCRCLRPAEFQSQKPLRCGWIQGRIAKESSLRIRGRSTFKDDIIQAFFDCIKYKPETAFGNVKADVLADKDPTFQRMNFCSVIRGSHWKG